MQFKTEFPIWLKIKIQTWINVKNLSIPLCYFTSRWGVKGKKHNMGLFQKFGPQKLRRYAIKLCLNNWSSYTYWAWAGWARPGRCSMLWHRKMWVQLLDTHSKNQSVRCDAFLPARTHFAPDNFCPHALRTHVCFLPRHTPHPHSHFKIFYLARRKI